MSAKFDIGDKVLWRGCLYQQLSPIRPIVAKVLENNVSNTYCNNYLIELSEKIINCENREISEIYCSGAELEELISDYYEREL